MLSFQMLHFRTACLLLFTDTDKSEKELHDFKAITIQILPSRHLKLHKCIHTTLPLFVCGTSTAVSRSTWENAFNCAPLQRSWGPSGTSPGTKGRGAIVA